MPHRTKRIFKAGDRIFNEGEAQDIAYIIEEGEVEIFTEFKGEKQNAEYSGHGSIVRRTCARRSPAALGVGRSEDDALLTVVTQQQVEERLADADPILRMVLFVVMRHFRSEVDRSRAGYGPYARSPNPRRF
jgi:CRP-like cAMP-binding protein